MARKNDRAWGRVGSQGRRNKIRDAAEEILRASQGNFDHLQGEAREFARQFNFLAEDVAILYEALGIEYSEDDTEPVATALPPDSSAALNAHIANTTTAHGHIDDTTDAHDASAISVVPFETITATNVQDALEQLFALIGGPAMSAGAVHINFGSQTIPGNEASTRINYTTTDFDAASMWDGGTFEFVVDNTGWWIGTMYILLENTGSFIDGYARMGITSDTGNAGQFSVGAANSRRNPATGGDTFEISHTAIGFLTAGDKVWVEGFQDTTETLGLLSHFAIAQII